MLIVTLIAANADTPSPGSVLDVGEALSLLESAGYSAGEPSWLEPDQVARIGLTGVNSVNLRDVRKALEPLSDRIDFAIRPADAPIPKLMLSDMDSTMIGQECIDELADFAGVRDEVTAITERAMQGELDFAASLKERVALLKGLPEHVIAECLAERVSPNPGARTLVRTMRKLGADTVLVSGGFHHFADPIAAEIGFQGVVANRLDVEDGHLLGTVSGPMVDAAMKAHVLERERGLLNLATEQTMALGDGANDIPMLNAAGFSAAYCAKPIAYEVADFAIRHNGLTAALYALGIPRTKWQD
ncbi:phosphoserine phosphatase SerB [Alterisphingorhabdus coralli]|uniref:Phosphoserine phosphatase n=1 Tax=Alterisphingorhabdus coralli TaxID=3071408 RepID=A0AA97F6R8_9SPHN|nr:phosphoserine phosphatase SerB [Parasphingorhabdus sp. SCSIO 66989]WOE74303.1 phosphoserine phosphatase SerB [Parasphingorhabdus sp. SCSIO 66989]